jgi:hypothetical protein
MDASLLDKGALCVGNKLGLERSKPDGHHFGNGLLNVMYETNWTEVDHILNPLSWRRE